MSATAQRIQKPHRRSVPVLMYHSLDRSGSVISIPPDLFRRQIERLLERGFTGITLAHLLDGWDGLRPLPRRPLVITFDDGLASVHSLALPILEGLGVPATVFAVSGYIGRCNRWPGQSGDVPRLPVLSWSALQELAAAGWEIGAHTISHPSLDAVPTEQAAREIVDSRRMIEDRLGTAVSSFAYPYGCATAEAREIVSSHFRAACGTRLRSARPAADRAELPRIDAYYFRSPALAPRIGTLSGNLYVRARRMAREWLGRATLPGPRSETPHELVAASCGPASLLASAAIRRTS